MFQAHCPAAHRNLTCHVIERLLTESKSLPDLARDISTSFLSQLLPLLLGACEEVGFGAYIGLPTATPHLYSHIIKVFSKNNFTSIVYCG